MRHLVIPGVDSARGPHVHPMPLVDASLGGMFYDYLRRGDGFLAGVRYWVDAPLDVARHPVFSAFENDSRFVFGSNYIDIVFSHDDVDALRSGQLIVDVVQDFGGEAAVKIGDTVGISFECED